jgi:WD40 repeat protein
VAGGRTRLLRLPAGWYLPGGDGLADPLAGQGLDTANGILVQSRESPGVGVRRIALWNPQTGNIEVIGRASALIDAFTPPGDRYSLLAWLPAGCAAPGSCLLKITDTASGAVTTVHSLTKGGFAIGGAFSPDGRSLAVFANSPSGRSTRLALVDPATGSLRLARMPAIPLGLDYGWARWLPGGGRLIAGALAGGYLVDATTLTASPHGSPPASINYTAVVIPAGRAGGLGYP